MKESEENFFMSDSLKDMLNENDLVGKIEPAKRSEANDAFIENIVGKVVVLDLKKLEIEIETSIKTAKYLLQNREKSYSAEFLDRVWQLSAERMQVHVIAEGKMKVVLNILNETKEDTYGRSI